MTPAKILARAMASSRVHPRYLAEIMHVTRPAHIEPIMHTEVNSARAAYLWARREARRRLHRRTVDHVIFYIYEVVPGPQAISLYGRPCQTICVDHVSRYRETTDFLTSQDETR